MFVCGGGGSRLCIQIIFAPFGVHSGDFKVIWGAKMKLKMNLRHLLGPMAPRGLLRAQGRHTCHPAGHPPPQQTKLPAKLGSKPNPNRVPTKLGTINMRNWVGPRAPLYPCWWAARPWPCTHELHGHTDTHLNNKMLNY